MGHSIATQIWWDAKALSAIQLKAPPTTEENRRKNRRAEIRLYPLNKIDPRNPDLIQKAQSCLNKLVGSRLIVNGKMEPETSHAIRSFQQRRGLPVNGIITPQTLSALINACPLAQINSGNCLTTEFERTPPELTICVDIDLCSESGTSKTLTCPAPKTGIYIPSDYQATESVDLIIYLHGHHGNGVIPGKPIAPGYFPTNLTINQYWNQANYPFWNFREKVDSSRKNVILVAPTLGSKSQAGTLTQPGGFDAYVDQILASLNVYDPQKRWKRSPVAGNIILACHSGGGIRMREIAALSGSKYASNIKECWGFDCTYGGDAADWSKWAKANPSRKVYIYYIRQCLLQDPTQPKQKWKAATCPSNPSGCANPKSSVAGGMECINTTREAITLCKLEVTECMG